LGLDITWYTDCTLVPDAERTPDGELVDWESLASVWVNPDFPGRADDLVDGGAYSYADSGDFRAGSYSGFNDWREALARRAGYPVGICDGHRHVHSAGAWAASQGPFWELINFSDAEGTIGTVVSAKLARDFVEQRDVTLGDAEAWFSDLYALWAIAFEKAANRGFVRFH
jgi:hypothetical protein